MLGNIYRHKIYIKKNLTGKSVKFPLYMPEVWLAWKLFIPMATTLPAERPIQIVRL